MIALIAPSATWRMKAIVFLIIIAGFVTTASAAALLVDRDTGNLTLSNTSGAAIEFFAYEIISTAGSLDEASWISIAGNYDAVNAGGDGTVDADDGWSRFITPGSRTDLAEGSLGEATLANNETIDLGNAWIASPFEDLTATLSLTNGVDLVVDVQFSGAVLSESITPGDFNTDGVINSADWPALVNNLFTDVSDMLRVDTYAAGDLNGNGRVDERDFELFKASVGFGSERVSANVPEPSVQLLFLANSIMFGFWRRHQLQ